MMVRFSCGACGVLRRLLALSICGIGLLVSGAGETAVAEPSIPPQSRIRVTVTQWAPTKGDYLIWAPLGGEFVLSTEGTVVLPIIGTVDVGTLDSTGLAVEIATRLQTKLGLIEK